MSKNHLVRLMCLTLVAAAVVIAWSGGIGLTQTPKPAATAPAATTLSADPAGLTFRFEDVTEKLGMAQYLKPWQLGHGGGWGDINGDGKPDLYIGTFAETPRWKDGPIPNMLFLSGPNGFTLSPQKELQLEMKHARTSNVIFADLDGDGDLDILAASHASRATDYQTVVWENLGNGQFKNSTPTSGYWPNPMGMRNTTVYDINGDGLLDIIACDGNYSNWKDGQGKLLVLINKGHFTFEDGSAQYGFPPDGTVGMGLAVGDINNDGLFDFFVADSNRLFVSGKDGKYHESQSGYFVQPTSHGGHTCGAVFGDLNGDGLLDLVTTEHGQPAKIHVYLNKGIKDGMPVFEDITARIGLDGEFPMSGMPTATMPATMAPVSTAPAAPAIAKVKVPAASKPTSKPAKAAKVAVAEASKPAGPAASKPAKIAKAAAAASRPTRTTPVGAPIKTAQLALKDFDNDGKLDIFIAVIWRNSQGDLQPLVLRNLGNDAAGLPHFTKIPMDRLVGYYAPAPVADYDRDGKMDIFTVAWFKWDQTPSILFHNITPGGHWLEVQAAGTAAPFNTMGVGSIVRIYEAGFAGDAKHLLGRYDIAVGTGYASGEEALAHFGLGKLDTCDVEISWQGKTVVKKAVKADQLLKVDFPGSAAR